MEVDLSLTDMFEKQFGYQMPDWTPKLDPVYGDTLGTRQNNGFAAGTAYYGKDQLGREVYLPITITYPDLTNNNLPKDLVLNYAVIAVTSRKKIVETPMTERKGTVKELIQIEDYRITIKGFLINTKSNQLPEVDVTNLRMVYECNLPVKLKCALTDIFLGSDQVVITDFNFPDVKGVKNVRPFELQLVNDAPFNLIDIS